jgi:hypothetical protein
LPRNSDLVRGDAGDAIGMDEFGASAPGETVLRE